MKKLKWYISRAGYLCREDKQGSAWVVAKCSVVPKVLLKTMIKKLNRGAK